VPRQRRRDLRRIRTADAHDADPTPSGRCGDGDDGVVGGEVHVEILSVEEL
jgi:hypothetical protein